MIFNSRADRIGPKHFLLEIPFALLVMVEK